ncbi:hypothetical protein [Endozoicomonas sp. SESOKO4]|uniref:hypothetical protein n=1 Tax=Endozoicomonas sp. SESOKO4 TaxID=2828745 RepID=UPI00214785C7|nr:hypothetical protein [Endozoicomonas sp. SESOKO4]
MNEEARMNETEELDDMLLEFFGKGGTFKDLKNMSDDAMEAIYSVAYNLYQGGEVRRGTKGLSVPLLL